MSYSIGLGWAWDLKPLYLLPRFLNISNVFLRLGQQWISLQTRISTAGGAFNTCGIFTSQQCLTEVFLDLYCAWRPWFDWFLQRLKIEKQDWLEGESPAFSSTFCTSERFAVVGATVLHEGGDAHQGQGGRGRWRGGSGWPCSRCPWSRACHCRCSRPQTSSPQRPAGESQLSFEVQTILNGSENKIFNRHRHQNYKLTRFEEHLFVIVSPHAWCRLLGLINHPINWVIAHFSQLTPITVSRSRGKLIEQEILLPDKPLPAS